MTTGFEARYQEDADPFGVRTSPYERRKLGIVLASLTRPRYRLAWDAACGTGDLVLALAGRADAVHASDAAPTAVRLTAEHAPDATTEVLSLPARPAVRDIDLVVLSEVTYYLTEADRLATYSVADDVAAADAELVAVSWRHHPGDAHLSGADSVAELTAWFTGRGWRVACTHDDTDFVAVHLTRGAYETPAPGAEAADAIQPAPTQETR